MTKKQFQILDAKPDRNKGALPIDNKKLRYHKKSGTFYTSDEGLAKEIDARFGRRGQEEFNRATVIEVPQSMTKVYEGTRHEHSYFFSVPKLPWKEDEDAIQVRKTETLDVEKRTRTRKKVERKVRLETDG